MKKRTLSFILVSMLVIVAGGFISCGSVGQLVEEPRVSLNSVNVSSVTLSGVDLIANVGIENPNGYPIPMPKIDWELFVNKTRFSDGVLDDKTTIKSHDSITVNVPINVSLENLVKTLPSLLTSTEAAYNINMALTFPIIKVPYKLEYSGLLPLPRLF